MQLTGTVALQTLSTTGMLSVAMLNCSSVTIGFEPRWNESIGVAEAMGVAIAVEYMPCNTK